MSDTVWIGTGKDMPAPRVDAHGLMHSDTVFSADELTQAHSHEAMAHQEPMPVDPCTGWDQA